jgi:hypothetical protein
VSTADPQLNLAQLARVCSVPKAGGEYCLQLVLAVLVRRVTLMNSQSK